MSKTDTSDAPLHLLTDPELRDINAWNAWAADHPFTRANLGGANLRGANLGYANLGGADLGYANLGGADLSGADLGGANLRGALGARRRDISSAVPVGSGELCSAYFDLDTKTVTIWGGCETFNSFAACHARIMELGGEHQKARLAWLKWVSVSLTGKKLKFWLDTATAIH